MLCGHIFDIIDCGRLYFDRLEGERYRRAHHLRRNGRADRDPELYQYQRGDIDPSQHGTVASLRKLWTDFRCMLFYGDRFRAECRLAA